MDATVHTSEPETYYDSFWTTLSRSNTHASNVYRYALIADTLRRRCPRPACLADLGCGNSTIVDYLRRQLTIGRYLGFDVSPKVVAVCNGLRRSACEFHQADLQRELPAAFHGIADAAISCEAIEHLDDYRPLLRNLARVLKPGGILALTTPSGKVHRLERELFGHIRHFDRDALQAEVAACGFTILEAYNCGFPVLTLERVVASLFVNRLKRALDRDFERSPFFRVVNPLIGLGLKLSSRRYGCQLVIVGRREGAAAP